MPLEPIEKQLLLDLVRQRFTEGDVSAHDMALLVEATEEQVRTALRAHGQERLTYLHQNLANTQNNAAELERQIAALEAYLGT